jgi:DNA-binding CsgD family transcriptional regulator
MQPAKTASILLDAARQIAPVDVGQARNALLDALAASLLSGRLAAVGATRVDIARAVRSMPQSPSAGSIGDLLLDADTALLLDGRQAAAPALSRAVDALQQTPLESADLLTWTGIGCWAAGALNDDGALYSLANRLEAQARDQAAVPTLSVALTLTGTSELFAGDLGRARVLFTEREAIEGARGEECGVGEAMVLAWQGQVSDARTRVAAAVRSATKCGLGWKLVYLEYALAVLELGQGHYEEALAAAPHGYDESMILSCFALPDLIEAAARCGEWALARDVLDRVEGRAAASPTPLALGLLARSRALLADGPDAEALFQEAISHLGHARGTGHLARGHLLYGEWLRREKRRRDAREHLRAAYGMFEAMGAGCFAERARLELAATGETARKRDPGWHGDLTPQELQVAVLAAAGSTNPEIAAQLFISPKTVDYHLGKVFRKLGVSSRRQLAGVPLGRP